MRRPGASVCSPAAARATGLRYRTHRGAAYVWAQLLFATAGIMLAGITNQPTAFQGNTYLLTSVFKAFPRELIEAAMIDGAGHFKLLWRMVVPIALPSLSVLFVFFFIWSFNEFFVPLIFLVSNDNQTVPLAIALAKSERGVVITLQSAASLLGILPCIIFFIVFQRTLTRGVTAGAVK